MRVCVRAGVRARVYLRQGQQVGQRQHHVPGKSIIGQLQQNYRGGEERRREGDELSQNRGEPQQQVVDSLHSVGQRDHRHRHRKTPLGRTKMGGVGGRM